MIESNSDTTGVAANELRILRERKEALQQAIRIAKAINRLQKGLHAVLLMGNSAAKIPKHAVRFYSELSADVKAKPVSTLKSDIAELDRRVRADFENILSLAQSGQSATAPPNTGDHASFDSANTQRLVDDFRRRAQTAVCLRIALRERGISSAPLVLSVPDETIRTHIANLEEKEQRHKKKIREDIVVMKNDVEKTLTHASLPEAMKHNLRMMLDGLRRDIEHIDAGKDIDELPFHVETVVEGESPPPRSVAAPAPKPNNQVPAPVALPRRSFFARVFDWLNTPWSVSWRDLAKRDQRPKSK